MAQQPQQGGGWVSNVSTPDSFVLGRADREQGSSMYESTPAIPVSGDIRSTSSHFKRTSQRPYSSRHGTPNTDMALLEQYRQHEAQFAQVAPPAVSPFRFLPMCDSRSSLEMRTSDDGFSHSSLKGWSGFESWREVMVKKVEVAKGEQCRDTKPLGLVFSKSHKYELIEKDRMQREMGYESP